MAGRPMTANSTQTGHISNAQKAQKDLVEQAIKTGTDQIQKPPSKLIDTKAKKEWKRVIAELNKLNGTVGNLDKSALIGYCNAYALYEKATADLQGEDLVFIDANGKSYRNPLIDVQMKYAAEMRQFATLCGISLSARLKSATVELDKQQQKITQEFGNI